MRQSPPTLPLRPLDATPGALAAEANGAGLSIIPIAALVLVVVALSGLRSCARSQVEAGRDRALSPTTVVSQEAGPS